MANDSNKPIKTFRDGLIKVAVWKKFNEQNKRDSYSVSIEKNYLEGDEWKSSIYLFDNELLKTSRLLNKAYDHIKDLSENKSS